jgi:hypothetical protein
VLSITPERVELLILAVQGSFDKVDGFMTMN